MSEKTARLYKVTSVRVANYLQTLGFRVISVQPSLFDPKYNTFFFYDTPELREAIKNAPPKPEKLDK